MRLGRRVVGRANGLGKIGEVALGNSGAERREIAGLEQSGLARLGLDGQSPFGDRACGGIKAIQVLQRNP